MQFDRYSWKKIRTTKILKDKKFKKNILSFNNIRWILWRTKNINHKQGFTFI